MSHAVAGEVLYNWRVFPLHLDQPPVAVLQQRQAHGACPDAAETRQLRGDLQSGAAQPGPVVGSSDGLHQAQVETQGASLQRQVQAGARPGKDACISWPEDGGLRKGPVVYRYAARSCSSEILIDCLLLCQPRQCSCCFGLCLDGRLTCKTIGDCVHCCCSITALPGKH